MTLLNKYFYNYIKEYDKNCSLEYILLNYNTIDFKRLSKYHTLDLLFLAIFQDDLDWNYISIRNDLTEEIVILYHDLISWRGIRHSDIYTDDFKRQYLFNIIPERAQFKKRNFNNIK